MVGKILVSFHRDRKRWGHCYNGEKPLLKIKMLLKPVLESV